MLETKLNLIINGSQYLNFDINPFLENVLYQLINYRLMKNEMFLMEEILNKYLTIDLINERVGI